MERRDYQQRAITDLFAVLDKRPILVAPTGSGKTVMATEFVNEFLANHGGGLFGGRVLWLAHRKELIEQAAVHLSDYGMFTGIIKAGIKSSPMARVQVAAVQTLARREKPPADLIIIDECHHARAKTYEKILAEYPDAAIVGLTATPFRLDGRGLGDIFGELIIAASPTELVEQGYLIAPRVYASSAPDLRGIHSRGGDYVISELAEAVNTYGNIEHIVETWKNRSVTKTKRLKTVVFAVNISHSKAITAMFCEQGVRAVHIDGSTAQAYRATTLADLRAGRLDIVSQCMILTEGWDLPALECVIIARPTASLNLHLQMLGRVMRATEGKTGALVLDHAGNHHVHGLVTRKLNYTLDGGEKVGMAEPLGLKRCRACGLFFDTSRFDCPECGWKPEAADYKKAVREAAGDKELTEFWDDTFEYRNEFWKMTEALRETCCYKPAWSNYRYKERFDEWPTVANGELVDIDNATIEDKKAVYADFLAIAERKGFKPGWAAYRYKDTFGVWPRVGQGKDKEQKSRDDIRKRFGVTKEV